MTHVTAAAMPKYTMSGYEIPARIAADSTPSDTGATPRAAKKTGIFSTRNIVLGTVAGASLLGGGLLGNAKGHGLVGLGIGAALATAAVGGALLGGASASYPDTYYDPYLDPYIPPTHYYPDPAPYYPPPTYYPPSNSYPSNPGYPTDGFGHTPNSPGDF